ncbi:class I SAM-dependent methyltransferase [Candidatus Woesebacteria bacterium]|nr:class I SAM-dependent methyltransferase [Candidatus Woesebacteria bacterium]
MNQTRKSVNSSQYRIKNCRICGSTDLHEFLSLNSMPIPNGFIPKKDLEKLEFHFPLKVCVCKKCWLVQLTHVIPADIMFKNYLYIPSTSTTVIEHFHEFAKSVVQRFSLKKKSLVIDIGSNDGILLSHFKKKGVPILGIDPAENLVKVANKEGIRTECAFFTEDFARSVEQKYGKASVISATNVIAHIDDLQNVMGGVSALLEDEGVFIMEAPYLVDLLERNEFDTIYHEHLSYFSVFPLQQLVQLHGLRIIDVQKQQIHGGSIRVFITQDQSSHEIHPRVEKYIIEEKAKGLHNLTTYDQFAVRVKTVRKDLLSFLKRLKKEGKTIAGYGAAAKGNVLMNYCSIDSSLLDFVVDSIPYKQGKYTPGTHVPIISEDKLIKKMPDYTLILAWNFADEIIKKNTDYSERGGRFIIPVPYLQII